MQLPHLTGQRSWIYTEVLLNCCVHHFRIRFAMAATVSKAESFGASTPHLHTMSKIPHQSLSMIWIHLYFSSSRSPTTTCLPFQSSLPVPYRFFFPFLNSWANDTTLNKCPYTGMGNWECQVPGTAEVYCLQLVLTLMHHRSNSGSIEAEI